MPNELTEGQNCWAVICPEPDARGAWGAWVKQRCVALGWPPSTYHLNGKTKHSNWAQARERLRKVKPDDLVIPYLKDHRFGIPGIVKRVAIGDDEWNPTVAKGGFSRNPDEAELGRRIEVEWLEHGVPPLNKIVVTPESMRGQSVVRATIERLLPKRHARFMKIIRERRNWEKYEWLGPLSMDNRDGSHSRESNGRRRLKKAASGLAGNELYLKRARGAFPVLVRQAQARQPIFYSDLADKLNMRNPRNLNFVLGAIGKAVQKLALDWKQEIPPIQCLVVNKNTGMPGEGIAWFISDLKDFRKRTLEERKQILGVELIKVFNYPKWELVLRAFGLTPLSTDPAVKTLMNKARHMGGVGECEDHRNLKHYIANNPAVLRLSDFEVGDTEYCFPSADRIDVVFRDGNSERWVGVEVKGPSSDDADILRGLFQCVKYAALREAELKSVPKKGSTRVVLVLSKTLPQSLKVIKNLLGVEVVEGIVVPPSFVPPGDRDQVTSAISK